LFIVSNLRVNITAFHNSQYNTAINQSINHAPSTIAAATSPRLANSVDPTGGFGESGEDYWKRDDDLLSVRPSRAACHPVFTLITTPTSNCDYSLPFVYIAYTVHLSSPTIQAMRDIP